MISVDTSTVIALLDGQDGEDIRLFTDALSTTEILMPPPVVAELHSRPIGPQLSSILDRLMLLPIEDGYWERAGQSRQLVKSKGLKAKLADALIAQCCIDAGVALITRDNDYRHFAQWCGLKLAL